MYRHQYCTKKLPTLHYGLREPALQPCINAPHAHQTLYFRKDTYLGTVPTVGQDGRSYVPRYPWVAWVRYMSKILFARVQREEVPGDDLVHVLLAEINALLN